MNEETLDKPIGYAEIARIVAEPPKFLFAPRTLAVLADLTTMFLAIITYAHLGWSFATILLVLVSHVACIALGLKDPHAFSLFQAWLAKPHFLPAPKRYQRARYPKARHVLAP